MDRVAILCRKDKDMMERFARLSLRSAGDESLLLLGLPFFASYIEANVKKEVDKDRIIIEHAAREYYAGKPRCDLDLEDMFERTKEVDKAFLGSLMIPSFSFHVRYSDFADIRIQRIWLLSKTVYALLQKWPDTATFRDAVRNVYSGEQLKERLRDILHLYNEETRILSKSLRLGPLSGAVDSYAETMYEAMEKIAGDLAARYARKIYGNETVHA